MNNNFTKVILSLVLITTMILVLPNTTYASNASASASASPSTVNVGDTVTVTVTFSGKNIAGVQGSYSYNSDILQFTSSKIVNGDGQVTHSSARGDFLIFDARGTTSLRIELTFKALKTGEANISFSTSDAHGIGDDGIISMGTPKASTKVTVRTPAPPPSQPSKPSQPSQPSQPTQPTKPPEPEPEPINPVDDALEVTVDGKALFMWTELDTVKLPDGFKAKEVTYGEDKVEMAVSEEQDLVLAYLTDKDGKNGTFYVYDSESNQLYPHLTFNSRSNYTILQAGANTTVPEGYVETELTLDDQTVQAWKQDSGENPDFFLIYAMNSEGEKGFYLYDSSEGTIQKFFDKTVIVEVEIEPEPLSAFQKLSKDRTLMGIMVSLTTLILILTGVLAYLFFQPKKKRPYTA